MNGSENVVQETLFFYCLVAEDIEAGPIVFALSSSGIKHGKNWNTNIMMVKLPNSGKRAPYYSSVWTLKTVPNQNEQGTWYQIGAKKTMIERIRFVTKEEFSNYILPIRESLTATQLDYSQMEQQQVSDNSETGEDVPF